MIIVSYPGGICQYNNLLFNIFSSTCLFEPLIFTGELLQFSEPPAEFIINKTGSTGYVFSKCHVIEAFHDLDSTKQAYSHPTSYNQEVLLQQRQFSSRDLFYLFALISLPVISHNEEQWHCINVELLKQLMIKKFFGSFLFDVIQFLLTRSFL